jgi:hypothetical protein
MLSLRRSYAGGLGPPRAPARVVGRIQIFEAERADCRDFRDVFAGFGPVEMRRVTGQHDHTSGRKCLYPVAIELIAETDVKHAGYDCVDPILPVRHQFCAAGYFHPEDVRTTLGGMANEDGKSRRRRKSGKRLPIDVFRKYRSENGLAWLVRSKHCCSPCNPRSRLVATMCAVAESPRGLLAKRAAAAPRPRSARLCQLRCSR